MLQKLNTTHRTGAAAPSRRDFMLGATAVAGALVGYLFSLVITRANANMIVAGLGLHVLVANAGIAIMTPLVDMSLDDWRRQNAVNIDGVFLSARHSIRPWHESGGGSILI